MICKNIAPNPQYGVMFGLTNLSESIVMFRGELIYHEIHMLRETQS